MKNYIVGLDIGSSKVCACVGKIDNFNNIQIVGVATCECSGSKKSVVVDIENTTQSIENCISQLEKIVGIMINDVYVSLPSNICELVRNKGVVAITSEDKEIRETDVQRALETAKIISVPPNKEIIGVIPQQYIIDSHENIKDPIGMSGLKLEVDSQILIVESTIIANFIKSINKAGLNINGFVFQPIANIKSVATREELEGKIAIIDIGAETSCISIFKSSNLLYTATIPMGGDIITNDISICLKIPYSEAERIKLGYANIEGKKNYNDEQIKVKSVSGNTITVSQGLLNEIIEARLEEIIVMIKNKAKDGAINDVNEIIIVGGGISYIRGIEGYITKIMGCQARIGIPNFSGCNSPIYATCAGIIKDVAESLKYKEANYFEKSDDNNFGVLDKRNQKKGILNKIRKLIDDFF